MPKKRKIHSPEIKAKAALEACKGLKTINEIAGEYQIHPAQLSQWKKTYVTRGKELFQDKRTKNAEANLAPRLYEEIGRLKVELDWLQKKV